MAQAEQLLEQLQSELKELLQEASECENIILESLRTLCLDISEEDIDEAAEFFLGPGLADDLEEATAMLKQEILHASKSRLLAFLRRHLSSIM